MNFVLFYHSLVSDWNHGNAHFLRGITAELLARGHVVRVYEPADGWSRRQLLADQGPGALEEFGRRYPHLRSQLYDPARLDLDEALDDADVVLVHEWNDPALVRAIGRCRRAGRFRLYFHDTHHRAASAPGELARYPLDDYDGALVFGAVLAELYEDRGWARRAFVWHEAADVRIYKPAAGAAAAEQAEADLVWVGNWGDGERSEELRRYLIAPAAALGLSGRVHGVRWPAEARRALADAGLYAGGWIPNYEVPELFHRHRFTVHVPRRFYAERLPGIPTIRVFEALACGIPLVSAPWEDSEGLFRPGEDFLMVRSGDEMVEALRALRADPELRRRLADHGRRTIERRHTCGHRVDELLAICAPADPAASGEPAAAATALTGAGPCD